MTDPPRTTLCANCQQSLPDGVTCCPGCGALHGKRQRTTPWATVGEICGAGCALFLVWNGGLCTIQSVRQGDPPGYGGLGIMSAAWMLAGLVMLVVIARVARRRRSGESAQRFGR